MQKLHPAPRSGKVPGWSLLLGGWVVGLPWLVSPAAARYLAPIDRPSIAQVQNTPTPTPTPVTPAPTPTPAPVSISSPWQKVREFRAFKGHFASINVLAFTPDGRSLASGGGMNDTDIRMWNVSRGKLRFTIKTHQTAVNALAISPNGETLITGGNDAILSLWNLKTYKLKRVFIEHVNPILSVAVSADSRFAASGALDGIRLWDLRTARPLKTLAGIGTITYAVAISPDGITLASGGKSPDVKLWNMETGQVVQTLTGHTHSITAILFSKDGRTLITGSQDRTIRVWDLATGKTVQLLNGYGGLINTLVLHPDGEILAAVDQVKITLWDWKTGTQLTEIAAPDAVRAIAFSPDGKTLVSGGLDKTVKLWQPAP